MSVSSVRHRLWRMLAVALIAGPLIAACGTGDADGTSNDGGSTGEQVALSDTASPDGGSAAVTEPAESEASEPTDPAPPLGSIDSWHNSEPLTLEQLRGSPVLLVFWADF